MTISTSNAFPGLRAPENVITRHDLPKKLLLQRGWIMYHAYVSEPHESAPPPAVQYAYSCVTYTTGLKGLTDCEWIIPGTLESAERLRIRLARMKRERLQ